jgi:hypothetical protein
MDTPTKPSSFRFKPEQREMLKKLAKQFSITEADVMRYALKQLYDRTFPAPVAPVRLCKECGTALTPGTHTHCEYCSKWLNPKRGPTPTEEEVVDRIIKGG